MYTYIRTLGLRCTHAWPFHLIQSFATSLPAGGGGVAQGWAPSPVGGPPSPVVGPPSPVVGVPASAQVGGPSTAGGVGG